MSVETEGKTLVGSLYSNADHEWSEGKDDVLASLRADSSQVAAHYAWDFCAYVWFEDGEWHEEVWQFKAPVDVLHNTDVEDLIHDTNERYGYR